MTFSEGVRIEVDPELLAALLRHAREVQPKLATGMRREVRTAAGLVRDVAVAEVLGYPAGKRTTGMREQLAGSIVVRIVSSATSRRQGVYVVSTGRLLPQEKKALVKAMNRREFRHEVFGDHGGSRRFATQQGARYFRPSTLETARDLMNARIRTVMDEALAGLVSR